MCAPEEAVKQIKKMDEIMMSKVVITFLPLKWGQRKTESKRGGVRLPVTSPQHVYDPVSSQIILISY